MAKEKDIDFLLEAYAQALTEFSDMFLLLLGSGPELEALKGMAAQLGIDSKLRFVGEVPYEHVPAYLMMADLFVMSSGGEVHPLSIIEAFAAGLPVLGLRVPGVDEVIVDGITGRLTYRIMSSYARAMVSLVQDRETLSRMSQEARREGHRNSILRTASRMLGLYQRLVDSGRDQGA
jgi:glycosyltransferase involved in cell wall biosynthesis